MSMIGNCEGFQPVSLKQEGDDQPSETDQLSMEGDPDKHPVPRQISRQPSVTESALYPNPYHQPYISRKYFATRPGAIETAMEDLKGHIAKTSGETIQGFWLLTEFFLAIRAFIANDTMKMVTFLACPETLVSSVRNSLLLNEAQPVLILNQLKNQIPVGDADGLRPNHTLPCHSLIMSEGVLSYFCNEKYCYL
ncbi:hypothetical protein HPG69_007141 [Diceros bicornis minor]|uniref:Uncharacterized protein n=1 Tax=Diceros bicornis minor TaxID=77932 RepID=A0A7J7F2L2_DICBM|nr:hypothetical protein HPG69_007141 [Diceros bicornis minor]